MSGVRLIRNLAQCPCAMMKWVQGNCIQLSNTVIEQFLVKRRSILWCPIAILCDRPQRLAPLFHPIKNQSSYFSALRVVNTFFACPDTFIILFGLPAVDVRELVHCLYFLWLWNLNHCTCIILSGLLLWLVRAERGSAKYIDLSAKYDWILYPNPVGSDTPSPPASMLLTPVIWK